MGASGPERAMGRRPVGLYKVLVSRATKRGTISSHTSIFSTLVCNSPEIIVNKRSNS